MNALRYADCWIVGGIVVAATWMAVILPGPGTFLTWLFVASASLVILHRRIAEFLGPLFFFELTRASRRGRTILWRSVYCSVLSVVLIGSVSDWLPPNQSSWWARWSNVSMDPTSMARLGSHCFYTFLAVQFAALYLLTPAFTAGAISEERERRTLDFVLATELTNREIVVGKLLSRIAGPFAILLSGLPILALIQLLGGIDPNLLLLAFVVTGLTLLSLGSLCLYLSAISPTTRESLMHSYAVVLLFQLLYCLPVHPLAIFLPEAKNDSVSGVLVFNLAFHGILFVSALGLAARSLRETLVRVPSVLSSEDDYWESRVEAVVPSLRPPMGEDALWWKETNDAVDFSSKTPVLLPSGCLFGLLAIPVFMLGLAAMAERSGGSELVAFIARSLGLIFFVVYLVTVVLATAGRVCREREQGTLETLLTIPDSARSILWTKLKAGLWSGRASCWFVLALWGLGIMANGISLINAPVLALGFVGYVSFVACLTLWFSANSPNASHALFRTMLTLIAITAAIWMMGDMFLGATRPWLSPARADFLGRFVNYGLRPPMNVVVPVSTIEDWDRYSSFGFKDNVLACLAGSTVYALAGWILWRRTLVNFRTFR